jgi:hypothetical protein
MSHGNRNLALARSRYTMTLSSESGQFLDRNVVDGRVRSQTWQFNNRTMFDIDPKYFFCHLRWVARRLGGGLCSCNSLQYNKTTSIINSKT